MVDGIVTITAGSSAGPFRDLSASRILLDPVRFRKSVADVTTAVDVTYLAQGVDDKGKPTTTETHVTVNGPAADVTRYGFRRYGLGTQLSQLADAEKSGTKYGADLK
jgi:hypothetical protein